MRVSEVQTDKSRSCFLFLNASEKIIDEGNNGNNSSLVAQINTALGQKWKQEMGNYLASG